jgi:hypothetical protein
MFRLVQIVRKCTLMTCLPLLGGVIAILATPTSNQAFGRTLSHTEMARSFGGIDYYDKCLKDVPGCDNLDDYYTYYMMCFSNSNSLDGCRAAPMATYNYGYVNTKGCLKTLSPATNHVTCAEAEAEVVCAYMSFCGYTEYELGNFVYGICVPIEGQEDFYAPSVAYDMIECETI